MPKGAATRRKSKGKTASKITNAKDAGCSVNNNGGGRSKTKENSEAQGVNESTTVTT